MTSLTKFLFFMTIISTFYPNKAMDYIPVLMCGIADIAFEQAKNNPITTQAPLHEKTLFTLCGSLSRTLVVEQVRDTDNILDLRRILRIATITNLDAMVTLLKRMPSVQQKMKTLTREYNRIPPIVRFPLNILINYGQTFLAQQLVLLIPHSA